MAPTTFILQLAGLAEEYDRRDRTGPPISNLTMGRRGRVGWACGENWWAIIMDRSRFPRNVGGFVVLVFACENDLHKSKSEPTIRKNTEESRIQNVASESAYLT